MFDFLDVSNIGKEYKGFILLKIDDLKDLKTKAVYLRHKKTGLEIYHILKDDNENTFAFAFRTLANDSKGAAHIMEHSVLCGSEKYPLKEPFSTLSSQSLNTFLNAITYPDKTVFPGSSLIRSDYFTMLDVYADAVFFPKLDYETFIQEGHRLEIDDNKDLSIQGVVYNEMKGIYSSFYSVVFSNMISTMYPQSYPSFESGGDPLEIPNLTYQEFLDFHKKFYNPENCLLFLYGNIPTQEQLDYFDLHFITRIEKKFGINKNNNFIDSQLPVIKEDIKALQKLNLVSDKKRIVTIGPDFGDSKNFVALCWYTGSYSIEKNFITDVLCGNDSSPLSKYLKESYLGDDIICSNFGQFSENFYILGLYGVKDGDEEKVFSLLENAVQKAVSEKINQKDIDGAVMGIDVTLRDVNRIRGPYAIPYMEKVLMAWSNGIDCSTYLNTISDFEKVKVNLKNNPDFLYESIKKIFMPNTPKVEFICKPSKDFFTNRKKIEDKLIQKLKKDLDINKLKIDLKKLHEYQEHTESEEELKCIPRTKISEIRDKISEIKTEFDYVQGLDTKIPVLFNQEETNGIFYMDVLFPYDRLESKYFKYIPFFSNVVTNLGWNDKKWDECISDISTYIGDVWGRFFNGLIKEKDKTTDFYKKYQNTNILDRLYFGITCQSIKENAEKTLNVLSQIITKMDFNDTKRLKTLIKELYAEKKDSIDSRGNDLVNIRNRCLTSPVFTLAEIQNGLSQLKTVKYYKNHSPKKILKIFLKMYQECLNSGALIHITADKETLEILKPLLSNFAEKTELKKLLPKRELDISQIKKDVVQLKEAESKVLQVIQFPTQTSFTSTIIKTDYEKNDFHIQDELLSTWMENHILWDKIRTSGGAYGVNASLNYLANIMAFSSYRDPNPINTINVFKNIFSDLKNKDFSQDEIERSELSIFGNLICPLSPRSRGEKGLLNFVNAKTFTVLQENIEKLLKITPKDLHQEIENLEKYAKENNFSVIFCDKSIKTSGNIIKIPL